MTIKDSLEQIKHQELMRLINFAGARRTLASSLKISVSLVHRWCDVRQISKRYAIKISKNPLYKKHFTAIGLRPDLKDGNSKYTDKN